MVVANASSTSLSSSDQQADAAAVASEAPSKRRSAAHSYRMQTESSLAKLSAGKESSVDSSSAKAGVGKKGSYTMMRFPSTPNIATEAREDEGCANSAKSSQRPGSVEGSSESQDLQVNAQGNEGSSVKNVAEDVSQMVDASDRTLMPPPMSTSVPLSYQATFIAKAAKHRRTTMPESLARSRELLAGALAKHHRLSDSSATDGDDSLLLSSSAFKPSTSTLDASPLEPPERDIRLIQSRATSAQLTSNSANAEGGGVTGTKVEHSDNTSSAGSSLSGSPRIVKIGRCVSPVRPQSASSSISQRRQLPPDPRASVSIIRGSAERVAAFDSVMSQLSVTQSASAESGMRLFDTSQDTDISELTSTCHSAESSSDFSKHHASQLQSPNANGQRPISSKTETRLVLDPDLNTENLTCTEQQTIINEIARYCTERRMSADQASQREVSRQEQWAAESGSLAASVGHARQQWDKMKPLKPLVIMSQSNSSCSQTPSLSACDSSALVDSLSFSQNSVSSVSSGSCVTRDVLDVAVSVSDSVVSYDSVVQMPTKLFSAAAANTADASPSESVLQTDVAKGTSFSEDEQISETQPSSHAYTAEKQVSAMASDRWVSYST